MLLQFNCQFIFSTTLSEQFKVEMADGPKKQLQVANISCVLPESKKGGGIFVGNIYGAQNADILKEYGIRSVITTSLETPSYDPVAIPFHLKIKALDQDTYSIIDHLAQCFQFIEDTRKHTNVLIHCYAGVSRSVSIVVAYLMKSYKWNLSTALAFVKQKRIVAKPNDGFMKQLRQFQSSLGLSQPIINQEEVRSNEVSQSIQRRNFGLALQNGNQHSQTLDDKVNNNNSLRKPNRYVEKPVGLARTPTASGSIGAAKPQIMNRTAYSSQGHWMDHERSKTNYSTDTSIQGQQNNNDNSRITRTHNLGYDSARRKHNDIPIPTILTLGKLRKEQQHNEYYDRNSSNQHQYQVRGGWKDTSHNRFDSKNAADKLEQAKTTSRLIRPKDLPGYRKQ